MMNFFIKSFCLFVVVYIPYIFFFLINSVSYETLLITLFSNFVLSLLIVSLAYNLHFYKILSILFYFISILEIIHISITGAMINSYIINLLSDVTIVEIFEYLSVKINIFILLSLLVVSVMLYVALSLFISTTKISSKKYTFVLNISFVVLVIIGMYIVSLYKPWAYQRLIYASEIGRLGNSLITAIRYNNVTILSRPLDADIIVIIGESLNRNHMSLYGYNRQTTPFLDTLNLNGNLTVFDNVISNEVTTVESLQKDLTFSDSFNSKKNYETPTILQVFKSAGYYTSWLSNQEASGVWANWINNIVKHSCDYYKFTTYRDSLTFDNKGNYDDTLLQDISTSLKQNEHKSQALFVHLYGSHHKYKNRYPHNFEKFNTINASDKEQIINEYDNSIVYNDYVLSQIIGMANARSKPTIIVYFSDHGEEVFDFRNFVGHDKSNISKSMVEIPFVVYVNDTFKSNNQQTISLLNTTKSTKYQLQFLSHFLSELLNVKHDFYNINKGLLYKRIDYPRYMGSIDYDTNSSLISKLGAHRVDSEGKLLAVVDKFNNIELDISLLENGILDIGHPPAVSIGLTVDKWLSKIPFQYRNSKKYWFDLKNLSQTNKAIFLQKIKHVADKNRISYKQIIIESGSPEALDIFFNLGFKTSYYLPDFNPTDLNSSKVAIVIENIKKSKLHYISFDAKNYIFINDTIIPNISEEIKLLSWAVYRNYNDAVSYEDVRELIVNPRLDILLVTYKTNYDR